MHAQEGFRSESGPQHQTKRGMRKRMVFPVELFLAMCLQHYYGEKLRIAQKKKFTMHAVDKGEDGSVRPRSQNSLL